MNETIKNMDYLNTIENFLGIERRTIVNHFIKKNSWSWVSQHLRQRNTSEHIEQV